MRRAVIHQINRKAETKMNYYNPSQYNLDPSSLYRHDLMGLINKGALGTTRIGDVVNVANIKVKYEIELSGVTQYEGTKTVRPHIYK